MYSIDVALDVGAPAAWTTHRGSSTMITGNSRIELAKMIGITPDWLTFSGM